MLMNEGVAFASGAFMGAASSLHCAAWCGGVASSLLLAASPASDTASQRVWALLQIQAGRAITYMAGGVLAGAFGAAIGALLDLAGLQIVFRYAGAAALVWSGLSIAGAAPAFAALDRSLIFATSAFASRAPAGAKGLWRLVWGLSWGLAPCALVYSALLNATLVGSAAAGGALMAGFSLGTVPVVASTALGVMAMARSGSSIQHKPTLRRVAGYALSLIGVASVAMPAMSMTELCLAR